MTYAEVIPFIKLPRSSSKTFTYAVPSDQEGFLRIGQFVKIPWRKKIIFGVIAEIHDRKPNFEHLATLGELIEEEPSWNKQLLSIIFALSEEYSASPSTVCLSFIPEIPKKKHDKNPESFLPLTIPPKAIARSKIALPENKEFEIIRLSNSSERLGLYQSVCEKAKGSVLILTPTQLDAQEITSYLTDNTDKSIHYWDNSLNKNQQWNLWRAIKEGAEVVISTRSGFLAPLRDLSVIIVDQEEDDDHKSWEASPYVDIRRGAKLLGEALAIPIYFSGFAPRIASTPKEKIVDFGTTPPAIQTYFKQRASDLFALQVKDRIEEALSSNLSPILIFTRKAAARTLHCLDCHFQWSCPDCEIMMRATELSLSCPICAKELPLPDTCPKCKRHRLRGYGLGIDGVQKILCGHYPPEKIVKLTVTEFEETPTEIAPGSIILTTGFMLKRLFYQKKFASGPIILFHPESILFYPDFHANEWFYHYLNWHRIIASDYFDQELLIQTSLSDEDPFYQICQRADYNAFRQSELRLRKKLLYPPFAKLTRIHLKFDKVPDKQLEARIHQALTNQPDFPVKGPYYRYRRGSIASADWYLKQTSASPPLLDKYLDSIYSKVMIDPDPLKFS